jgi:phosphatidylglycerophosphatase A
MALKKIIISTTALSSGQKFLLWFLSLGKIGLCPVAPGTAGSLATVLVLAAFFYGGRNYLAGWSGQPLFWIICGGIIILSFYGGLKAINKLHTVLGQEDFSWIVFDEAVGIFLTTFITLAIVLGRGGAWHSISWVKFWILIFGSFRIFDILKVFPGSWFDKNWVNGAGIMLDDLVAALYAGILSGVTLLFWP